MLREQVKKNQMNSMDLPVASTTSDVLGLGKFVC